MKWVLAAAVSTKGQGPNSEVPQSKTCTAPALQEARHHSPHGKAQGSNTPHRDTEPGSGPTLLRFTREIRMSQKIPTFGHKSGSASSQQQCTSDAITVTRWAMFTYMFSDLASYRGFPASSVGEESACNAGDPSSIPGSGRSPGERIGYPLQHWTSVLGESHPRTSTQSTSISPGPPYVLTLATARTVDHQAPLSMEFSRLEYWSG